jgi:hypothetical protein
VDQYDAALSTYVSAGDDTALNALAHTIAKDSLALAVQDGEITPEEAANGALEKALGFEPGPLLVAAVEASSEPTNEQPQQPNQQWTREQPDAPQLGDAPANAPSAVNGTQVSFSSTPSGTITPAAQQRREREGWQGAVEQARPNYGGNLAAIREAARADASRGSRAVIAEAPQDGSESH